MASARGLTLLFRRSVVATRATSALQRGGVSPPIPPFARIPVPSQQLTENNDILFDDGVAPELALDFDSPHISSTEALLSCLAALTGLGGLYYFISTTNPESKNPAVSRKMNMVIEPVPLGPPPPSTKK